jgi:para-nitrobenzyl esterase
MSTPGGIDGTTVLVTTTNGPIRGLVDRGVNVFRGVRYAAPAMGELRFKPPVRPEPWTEPADCTVFGATAPQPALPLAYGDRVEPRSEDCLFLNVWTPGCDDARRPVMLWLHGGGFTIGSGSTPSYDGTHFATRHDVVIVTINYRLGALGFLSLGDLAGYEASANSGLLDQVAALEWVRDNITAFGGDAGNVTIFGESAGAFSVAALMAAPSATGLFHKAIAESGAAGTRRTVASALDVTERLCATIGRSIMDLPIVPVEELLEGQQALTAQRREMAFAPTVDGNVLPSVLDRIAAGSATNVPLIIGTNLDEARLFALMSPDGLNLTEDDLLDHMRPTFRDRAQQALDTYRAARPNASTDDLASAYFTDATFRVPAVRMAEQQAKHAATYMYLFAWPSPAMDGKLGSCHGLEIPFVFNSIDETSIFLPGPPTPAMEQLSLAMHDAWASFARTGDPNHQSLPEWPRYEPSSRATMTFDEEQSVELDPYGAELALF